MCIRDRLYSRFMAFNFSDKQFSIGNLSCDEKGVYYEDKSIRSISLIDIDEINLSSNVTTYTVSQEIGKTFPIDNLAFLLNVNVDTILYLSLIHISEPTRRTPISYAVFCLKKKK